MLHAVVLHFCVKRVRTQKVYSQLHSGATSSIEQWIHIPGQGVVQMAKSQQTRMDYAIKFYVSQSAFQEECSMYQPTDEREENELIQFLPQVLLSLSNYVVLSS